MKANKKTDKVKTGLPVNEIRILCRTTAPVDVILKLGQSKDIQKLKQFTYLGFEFCIVDVRSVCINELFAEPTQEKEKGSYINYQEYLN